MKVFISIFSVVLGVSSSAFAEGWSCDCYIPSEGQTWIIDGNTKQDARQECLQQGGQVKECLPRGRGDRLPAMFGESVLVPANPGGVDVCRDYIAYHKKINSLDITLGGRTPEDMTFLYKGKIVGKMKYDDDGSEAALCTVL